MNTFDIKDDIQTICELLDLSEKDFAKELQVSRTSIINWKNGDVKISPSALEKIYDYAFLKGLRLNKIKEQLFKEEFDDTSNTVLFHGAKSAIEGELSVTKSKPENDFGRGFYCGESFEQSAMFVSGYPNSSVYITKFHHSNDMRSKLFKVDQDWMLTIAYFRNKINEYVNHPIMKRLISSLDGIDYIVAPIADNRMYQIIDEFINGEITDVQCQHCLSATSLGNQYVFVTDKAIKNVKIIEKCYLTSSEKEYYLNTRQEETKVGNDKVKIAKREYRGQGLYIDQILK